MTGRDLVLKAGQLGITTWGLARGFKRVITQPNTTAVLVAHEEFLTQRLLLRVEQMYKSLKLPNKLKPKQGHSSSYEKSFPELNSVFYIGTAGAKVFGRGEPIHYFQGSELAFWPGDPDRILFPMMQRVPLGGEILLESTPNGEGSENKPNVFYRMVQESLEGLNTFTMHLLYWWLEPAYRIEKGSKLVPEAVGWLRGDLKYDEEELALIRRIGWDDLEAEERIRWRRLKILEIKKQFWQEMIEDIESCFLTVSEPFYEYDYLDILWKNRREWETKNSDGAMIWYDRDVEENHPVYTISVDPGQGKNTSSEAIVWRHDLEEFRIVREEARLSGFYTPTQFAPMVMRLGEYYYGAQIVSENNGHGMAFCAEVKGYGNLYYSTGIVSGVVTKEIGWKSTGAVRIGATGTKMYALTALQQLLPQIVTHDEGLIRQLRQVRWKGEQVEFLGMDDIHDCAMIMAVTRTNYGRTDLRGFRGGR
jgi:hypothetical protein